MIYKQQEKKGELNMKRNLALILALSMAVSIGLLSTNAFAAQQGHIQLTSKVQKMVMVIQDGKKVPSYVPATKVLPGETIQYSTYFENISNQPAGGIKIVNPIPAHTAYLQNSAHGQNTQITFSVDGGRHYGKAGTLKVRGMDGKHYSAKPSDYTHIRWQYHGSLSPSEIKTVGFKARLL